MPHCMHFRKPLQELAHLYHYYLHGEQGNRGGGGKKERLPNGEPFPDIALRYQVGQGGGCCSAHAQHYQA